MKAGENMLDLTNPVRYSENKIENITVKVQSSYQKTNMKTKTDDFQYLIRMTKGGI